MRVSFSTNSGESVRIWLVRRRIAVGSLELWTESLLYSLVAADHHPQQSVLKPQAGHRQTACIRYISDLPHRSQMTASSRQAVAAVDAES